MFGHHLNSSSKGFLHFKRYCISCSQLVISHWSRLSSLYFIVSVFSSYPGWQAKCFSLIRTSWITLSSVSAFNVKPIRRWDETKSLLPGCFGLRWLFDDTTRLISSVPRCEPFSAYFIISASLREFVLLNIWLEKGFLNPLFVIDDCRECLLNRWAVDLTEPKVLHFIQDVHGVVKLVLVLEHFSLHSLASVRGYESIIPLVWTELNSFIFILRWF